MDEVTSGFFMDKAFPLIRWELFDGINLHDSNICDYGRFLRLFGTLMQANVDSTKQLPDVQDYRDALAGYIAESLTPVAFMHYEYHRFDDSASAYGLVYFDGIQLFDSVGRTQSPYVTGRVVAATTALRRETDPAIQLIIPSALFLNNTEKTVAYIQFAADVDSSYRTVEFDEPFSTWYASGGLKTMRLKVKYTDSSSFEAHFGITVAEPGGRYDVGPDDEWTIPAVAGQHSGGAVQIAYGCGNSKLVKPLIVVEGFNPEEWGDYNYVDFQGDLEDEAFELHGNLEQEGYDLVFINFNDGADFLERNTRVVIQAIEMVNAVKAANESPYENVVMGLSMGAILARLALAQMEGQSIDHETRLYISFDGEHLGANIPLGYQYMIDHFGNHQVTTTRRIRDFLIDVDDALNVVTSPAARQMLAYQNAFDNIPSLHGQYLNMLNTAGYPQQTRNVAITNGSGVGIGQPFGAHHNLLHINDVNGWMGIGAVGEWLLYHVLGTGTLVKVDVWAVPNNPTSWEKIYEGRYQVKLLHTSLVTIPRAFIETMWTRPYDNAPGGEIDVSDYVPAALPNGVQLNHTRFNFAPSVSGVDLVAPNNNNLFSNLDQLNITNPTNPLCPFENYRARETFDAARQSWQEPHLTFSLSNEDLLEGEIIGSLESSWSIIDNEFYNFGAGSSGEVTTDRLRSVAIQNDGILYVNANTEVGEEGSGNSTPTTGSTFHLFTSGAHCNFTVVDVKGTGTLEIGSSTSNKGILRVSSNSTLILRTGSTLRIHDNSRLIIESGATLQVYADATIELLGHNAILEFRGHNSLVIKDNATFTFSGDGFVRFDMPSGTGPNIASGTNSKFYLQGTTLWTDKILEVKGDELYPKDDLAEFILDYGKVELGSNTRLNLGCPVTLDAVKFTKIPSIGGDYVHRGVHVYGQHDNNAHSTVTIDDCWFEHGKYGIYGALFYGEQTLPSTGGFYYKRLKIEDCIFRTCDFGVYTVGEGAVLDDCSFSQDLNYGWRAEAPTWHCEFRDGFIDHKKYGLHTNYGQVTLTIGNSIIQNGQYGVFAEGTSQVRMSCGAIKNHDIGMLMAMGSHLQLASAIFPDVVYLPAVGESGNVMGNVLFDDNDVAIYAYFAGEMLLNKGNNDFTSSVEALDGGFAKGTTYCTKNYPLYAESKKWDASGNPPIPYPNSGYNYSIGKCGTGSWPLSVIDNSPLDEFEECPGADDQYQTRLMGSFTISTADYTSVLLHEAVEDALTFIGQDSTADNLEAINRLSQILTSALPAARDSLPVDDLELLRYAELGIVQAASNAFLNGETAPLEFDGELDGEIGMARSAFTYMISDYLSAEDTFSALENAVRLTQLYRMAGLRDSALSAIDDLLMWTSFETMDHVIRLRCLVQLEKDVLDSLVSPEDFEQQYMNCPGSYSTKGRKPTVEPEKPHRSGIVSLYPNPTSDMVTIDFHSTMDNVIQLRVIGLQGNNVLTLFSDKQIPSGSHNEQFSTATLPAGVYAVELIGTDFKDAAKLVVIR